MLPCTCGMFVITMYIHHLVNLIIANDITLHLTAEEYMDKGESENELKQVTELLFINLNINSIIIIISSSIIHAYMNRQHICLKCYKC
jgi:hypothetical protein